MQALNKWRRALDQLIFPPETLCPFCGERPSLNVGCCGICLDALAIRWRREEIGGRPCFSLFPYQGQARELIHRLKFQNRREIAYALGYMLGLAAREEPELAKVRVLVPVPLHAARLEQRGFNQAELLADGLREVINRPICHHLLRVRATQAQSGLSAEQRKCNLRRAFAIIPGFKFGGKCCLIVDDVLTSGQTFGAVADLIERYGGRPLGVFAARTEIWEGEGPC